MMKTLRLNEGDPIRLTGTTLPKGKFVKLQAQTVDFLEVSDPKAVYVFLLSDALLSYHISHQPRTGSSELHHTNSRRYYRDLLQLHHLRIPHHGN